MKMLPTILKCLIWNGRKLIEINLRQPVDESGEPVDDSAETTETSAKTAQAPLGGSNESCCPEALFVGNGVLHIPQDSVYWDLTTPPVYLCAGRIRREGRNGLP